MPMETFTIEQYLKGKVRNVKVTDDALPTILVDAGKKAGAKIEAGADV